MIKGGGIDWRRKDRFEDSELELWVSAVSHLADLQPSVTSSCKRPIRAVSLSSGGKIDTCLNVSAHTGKTGRRNRGFGSYPFIRQRGRWDLWLLSDGCCQAELSVRYVDDVGCFLASPQPCWVLARLAGVCRDRPVLIVTRTSPTREVRGRALAVTSKWSNFDPPRFPPVAALHHQSTTEFQESYLTQ